MAFSNTSNFPTEFEESMLVLYYFIVRPLP